MAWPLSGGDTRIKLISSGVLSNPRVGDIINVKLGRNIVAGGTSALINRGSGFQVLTTSFPYTLQAADVPAVGGTYPIYAIGTDLNLRSDTVNMMNPARVPGAPTIGVAVAGNGQAGVRFTAPTDDGGSAIINYTIYALDPQGNVVDVQTATVSPWPFTGLTNGNTYMFRVAANNAIGASALSASSNAVTPMVAVDFNGTPESVYSNIPTAVYGETQSINGVPFQLVRNNSTNSRYAVVPGTVINSTLNNTANDSVNGMQLLTEIEIPGLGITNGDRITVTYRFNAPQTFGTVGAVYIRFANSGDMRKFNSNQSGSTTNGSTLNITTIGTAGINIQDAAGQYFFASGGNLRDMNLFSPFKIQLLVDFQAANTGKTMTGTLSATFTPSLPAANPGPGPFVDVRDRPYMATSPWNTPLAAAVALQTASDPETVAFRDRTGGQRFWLTESLRVFQTAADDPMVAIAYNSIADAPIAMNEMKDRSVPGVANLRFPPNVSVAESGGDNNLAVFSADGRIYREFYKYTVDTTTGARSCSVFTEHDLYGWGLPVTYNRSNSVNRVSNGIRAGGCALLPGLLRKADLDRGYVDHMLVGITSLGKTRKVAPFFVAQTTTSNATSPTVIDAGGTGYVVGEVLTLVGGTGRAAELTVTTIGTNGAVTGVYVSNVGTYTVAPTGSLASTSNKAGTGAMFTPNVGSNNSLSCRNWPATNVDSGFGNYTSVNGAWIGSVWTIPQSVDIDALNISTNAKIFAKGIQRYGWMVMDTADTVTTNLLCYAGDVTRAQAEDIAGYSGAPRFKCDTLELLADMMVLVRNNVPQFPGGPGARGPAAPTVGPFPLF